MKKLGLGVIGLILVSVIYYFTAGSEKLTNEMKTRVNTELTMIEQNGFAVQEREVKEKKEHFVLTFDDPIKIVKFFKQQGSEMTLEDAQVLKGMKVGVDLKYLNDRYSALSADIYPLQLPDALTQAQGLKEGDKAWIVQLNDMLSQKALLIHVDFNKLLSSFNGYVKDMKETFKVETLVNLTLKGLTFEGEIKDDRVTALSQKIETLSLTSGDDLKISLNKLTSQHSITGKSLYDTQSEYSLGQMQVSGKKGQYTFSIAVKELKGSDTTSFTKGLASNKMKVKAKEITLRENGEDTKLHDTSFVFNINNLDIASLEALETVDINNEIEINRLVQVLISKGITMEVPEFAVNKLYYLGKDIDGFSIASSFQINKNANLALIRDNPFTAVDAINTKTKIVLSEALFTLIAQEPKMMMLAMIIQPKIVNGKKVYELELKDGKLSVNGQSLM